MTYRLLLGVLVSTLVLVCSPAQSATPKETPKKQAVAVESSSATATKLYGETLPSNLPTIELAAVLKDPKAFTGKTGVLTGYVRQACTKKGCWMEISASADPKAKSCRVKFKDYGFFVPLDSAGSKARLAATAAMKVVSKAYVDHYEAEGGSFADKNPDGTANEIQLMATGVELTR